MEDISRQLEIYQPTPQATALRDSARKTNREAIDLIERADGLLAKAKKMNDDANEMDAQVKLFCCEICVRGCQRALSALGAKSSGPKAEVIEAASEMDRFLVTPLTKHNDFNKGLAQAIKQQAIQLLRKDGYVIAETESKDTQEMKSESFETTSELGFLAARLFDAGHSSLPRTEVSVRGIFYYLLPLSQGGLTFSPADAMYLASRILAMFEAMKEAQIKARDKK